MPAFLGGLPRFPERRVVNLGGSTYNNIRVDRSTIGVLNTGTIGNVDGARTRRKQAGESDLAAAVKAFTEALLQSSEAGRDVKNQVLEILSAVAAEATAPKEKRRPAVIRPLLQEISTLVQGVAALSALWAQYGPLITRFFASSTCLAVTSGRATQPALREPWSPTTKIARPEPAWCARGARKGWPRPALESS